MLDINKELEKFNRLLEDIEEDSDPDPASQDPEAVDKDLETASKSAAQPTTVRSQPLADATASGESGSLNSDPHTPTVPPKPQWKVDEKVRAVPSGGDETLPEQVADSSDDTRAEDAEVEDVEAIAELDAMTPKPYPDAGERFVPSGLPQQHVAAFDSLIQGARSALTGSHRQKPKTRPPVTVTLPSPEELEEDLARERGFRERFAPMITARVESFQDRMMSVQDSLALLQDRMGVVVGVAAAVVVVAAGVAIIPRMLSGDSAEPEAVASVVSESDSVHLLSSADGLVETEKASLTVSTFPPGARVYLGSELIGVTPFQGISVDRGFQSITIKKADYLPVDTMFTMEGSANLFFELQNDPSTQFGSDLGVEGDEEYPVAMNELTPESTPTSPETTAARDEPMAVVQSQRPDDGAQPSRRRSTNTMPERDVRGSVVITSDPAGATVFFDDQAVGETPLTLTDIETGRKRVTMQREGYVPYEIELNVMPSLQTPFHAVLAPMKGRIELQTTGGADLYVDGVLIETAVPNGYTAVVDVGRRAIRLVHPRYGEWTADVTVEADSATPVEVDLEEVGYEAAIRQGDRLFEESRYEAAIESFNRALSIRPGSRTVENKIGLAAKAMAETGRPAADASGVYTVADSPPELIGGLEALHRNVQYPEEAYNAGVQGRVYVQFVVDENGRAQNVTITKGLPMGCNEAAIRAIERSRFKPGVVDGKPVKVRQTLFVNFTID